MIERMRYKAPSGRRMAYYLVTCGKGCHGTIAFTPDAATALEEPLQRTCRYDAELKLPKRSIEPCQHPSS